MIMLAAGQTFWGVVTLAVLGLSVALGIGIFLVCRALDRVIFQRRPGPRATSSKPWVILPDPLPETPVFALWLVRVVMGFFAIICIHEFLQRGEWPPFFLGTLALSTGATALWTCILHYVRMKPGKRQPITPGLHLLLVSVPLVLVVFLSISMKTLLPLFSWGVGLILGVYAGIYLLVYQLSDRRLTAILKRGDELGDIDGAIAELHSEIEVGKPTWQHHELLGRWLMAKRQGVDAYKEFLVTEILLGRSPLVVADLALALSMIGRSSEALAMLVESKKVNPHHLDLSLSFARVLADLDHLFEARAWFEKAEDVARALKVHGWNAGLYRRRIREQLAALRADIESKEAALKPFAADLAEL